METISPQTLIEKTQPEEILILDVREPFEHDMAKLPNTLNVPLMQLPEQIATLAKYKDEMIYCLCHHGVRSAQAAQFLANHGFKTVNISGGIDAWADVNPNVKKY